jgi:hypothetical protein
MLQFRVFIRILEIHDFNLPSDSEGSSSSERDFNEEDYLGNNPDRGFLQPSLVGDPWLSLPSVCVCGGGGVDSWLVAVLGGTGLQPPSRHPSLHRVGSCEPIALARWPPSARGAQLELGE